MTLPDLPSTKTSEELAAEAAEIRRRLIAEAQQNVDDIVRQMESALRGVVAEPVPPEVPDAFARQWTGLSEVLNDPRTGLASRALFWDRLQQTTRHFRRHSVPFAVLYLGFRGSGEEHIPFISDQLARVLRATDTVAYTGGGEFAVLLAEISSVDDGALVASKLRQRLGGLGDMATGARINLAVGSATPRTDDVDATRLLHRAHSRMRDES